MRKKYKTDEEAFRKLKSDIKRLSCLENDEEQFKHALCTALWAAVEGCTRSFNEMTKMTKTGVEAPTDSIQKFEIYGACSNTYSNNHGRSA